MLCWTELRRVLEAYICQRHHFTTRSITVTSRISNYLLLMAMRRYVLRGNRRLAFGDVFHRGGRFVVRNIKANMLFSTLWW